MYYLLTLAHLLFAGPPDAVEEPARQPPSVSQTASQWAVGDQWVVQTQTTQAQARCGDAGSTQLRWRFEALADQTVDGRQLRRLRVVCDTPSAQAPVSELWFDRRSGALIRLQSQVPAPDGFRSYVQEFHHRDGRPSAVLTPISALPLDWPALLAGGEKDAAVMTYSVSAPKVAGDAAPFRFRKRVKQSVRPLPEVEAKDLQRRLVGDAATPLREVVLEGDGRRVRQLWRAGLPWPVLTDNGLTTATLVQHQPADRGANRR